MDLTSIPYGPATAAFVAVITVLFKIMKPLFNAVQFHDKHWVRKHLVHLKAVRSSASRNAELKQYLDDAIQLETFRIASGVTTSRAKMEFLLKLSRDGVWTQQQLRAVSKFLTATPGQLEPSISFTWADRVGAGLGLTSTLFILLAGGALLLQHMLQGGLASLALGLAIFSICVVIGTFFSLDYINFRVAKRVQEHLALSDQNA